MKVKVVSRAFYDDAYLDFFLCYYLGLGFDNITILKADAAIFDYKLPDHLSNEDKERITIIPVNNDGNEIVRKHYKYYKDSKYDWVLNVDSDELLIIDISKYPNGIKDYITATLERVKTEHNLDPMDLQQIQFRWLCINKMNIRFKTDEPDNIQIINNITNLDDNTNLDDKQDGISTNYLKLTSNKDMLSDYVLSNKLEAYCYIKSLATPKQMTDKGSASNCHFFPLNKIENAKSSKIKHNILLDNNFININNSNPYTLRRDNMAMNWGFILHLNTRSLANAVTKCLVTKLRVNKQISNLDAFRTFINNTTINTILPVENELTTLKSQFMSYLNSKRFFPIKIKRWHMKNSKFIPETNYLSQLTSILNNMSVCKTVPCVNLDTEMAILSKLCETNKINFTNLKWLLSLF